VEHLNARTPRRRADENLPPPAERYSFRRVPMPSRSHLDSISLVVAQPQDQFPSRLERLDSPAHQERVAAERAAGNQIEAFRSRAPILKPRCHDIDIINTKRADGFRKKRGLFLIGFDKKKFNLRAKNLYRQSGKTTACTNVGQPTVSERHMARGEETFAEMARQNLFRVGQRRESNLFIPKD